MSSRIPSTLAAFTGLCMLALLFGAAELRAQVERPLLVEGTNTVFQRVLTRPGTSRRDGPEGGVVGHYPAFQPLYVFAREGTWIRVGGATTLPPEGWVSEEAVIAWRHNIVAAFANPAGRERQLLFEDLEALDNLIYHERAVTLARNWREVLGRVLLRWTPA